MPRKTAASVRAADYQLRLPQVPVVVIPENVTVHKGNKTSWPVLEGVSIAQVEIPVGKWRAPHYHTNTPELAVIVAGSARAGLISPTNELFLMDLKAGDCVFFPMGWPHWLRNTGKAALQTYFNYGHEQPITFEIGNIVAQIKAGDKSLTLKGRTVLIETE